MECKRKETPQERKRKMARILRKKEEFFSNIVCKKVK
jgi:hypothetical protein